MFGVLACCDQVFGVASKMVCKSIVVTLILAILLLVPPRPFGKYVVEMAPLRRHVVAERVPLLVDGRTTQRTPDGSMDDVCVLICTV